MSGAGAPGKLVISGEYAVLDGAPAIVMAVDRRALVTVEPATSCRVQARGPEISPAAFTLADDGTLGWQTEQADDDYRLLGAVMATLAQDGPLPTDRPFDLRLDTSAFYGGADKLGLGSSAALTVALTAALCRHFGRTFGEALAYEAHRRLQGGEGSGLDIAASIAGGLIRFIVGDVVGNTPSVQRLRWPDGLEALLVWTGRSARTTPRVRRYREWRRSAAAVAPARRLIRSAVEAADAWQSGETQTVLAATAAYARMLTGLGEAAGLDISGGGHTDLARLADAAGVVYKPSGAGGGDLGLALAGDRRRLQSFRAAAERAGFRPLVLRADDVGLATLE